jgi:hypothetical protein
MFSVLSSGSPAWILLLFVVPSIVVFAAMAVTQYVRAKRKDSPRVWRSLPWPWPRDVI